ncbi:MAG: hypothetical protein AB8C84_00605 [Oligoflexales bacterium]
MLTPLSKVCTIILFFSFSPLTAQSNEEWEAPSSPPLFQPISKKPNLSIGLHSNIGQSRPNDGSSLSPAWYSGVSIGYTKPLSAWNFLNLRAEAQTGHIASGKVSIDQDIGVNFVMHYGTKTQKNISLAWIAGVGLAKGQWKSEEQTGSSLLSLFRVGYGGLFPFTESTRLGVNGLLDFTVHRFNSHPTDSIASHTQFTMQLSIEHLLPLQ